MQRTQRLRQAHHPLRQLRRQQFANRAGFQQLKRLIGEFAQRRLLNAFSGWVDRSEGFLQLRGAHIALYAIFRVDHLGAKLAAFSFAVGQHATTGRQAVFHRRVEVEKTHGQDAGAVADLTGHHPAAAEGDIAVEHFTLYGCVDARQQFADLVQVSPVFIA